MNWTISNSSWPGGALGVCREDTCLFGAILKTSEIDHVEEYGDVEVITSQGHRARDIQREIRRDAPVHSLGLTTLIAPGRYLVSDYRGQRFVAEIHRCETT